MSQPVFGENVTVKFRHNVPSGEKLFCARDILRPNVIILKTLWPPSSDCEFSCCKVFLFIGLVHTPTIKLMNDHTLVYVRFIKKKIFV